MSGPRNCCPCKNCIVFEDHFDRRNPSIEQCLADGLYHWPNCEEELNEMSSESDPPVETGYYPFDLGYDEEGDSYPIEVERHRPAWIPSGDWWWSASTQLSYTGDGAVYEISGNGELWCAAGWSEGSAGYAVSVRTIDEQQDSIFRILICLDINSESATYTDCGILEFCNGHWMPPAVNGWMKLIVRIGGVETLVKEESYAAAYVGGDYNGRIITVKWEKSFGMVCAALGDVDAVPPYLCVTPDDFAAAGVSMPEGNHSGIANASGDSIPVEFDDFYAYRHDDPAGPQCFSCVCLCSPDDPGEESAPIPDTLVLRIIGPTDVVKRDTVFCAPATEPPPIDMEYTLYRQPDECIGVWLSGFVADTALSMHRWKFYCPGLLVLEHWFWIMGAPMDPEDDDPTHWLADSWYTQSCDEAYDWWLCRTYSICTPDHLQQWTFRQNNWSATGISGALGVNPYIGSFCFKATWQIEITG